MKASQTTILETYRIAEIVGGVQDTLEDCHLHLIPSSEQARFNNVLRDVIRLKNDLLDVACEMEEENLTTHKP